MMTKGQKKQLGEHHKRILRLLAQDQADFRNSPSFREIMKRAFISSTSMVRLYLDELEEMGFIQRPPLKARSIRLLKLPEEMMAGDYPSALPGKQPILRKGQVRSELISIRIQGTIQAGAPLPVPSSGFEYLDAESTIEVASSTLPAQEKDLSELYALKVIGDSMVDAMVNDGDVVIMKPAREAHNGEMVAIWLKDVEETTLKYFYLESGGVRLQPANPNYKPLLFNKPENLEIQGKLVLVIRQMK